MRKRIVRENIAVEDGILKLSLLSPHQSVYVNISFSSASVAIAGTIMVSFVFSFATPDGVPAKHWCLI